MSITPLFQFPNQLLRRLVGSKIDPSDWPYSSRSTRGCGSWVLQFNYIYSIACLSNNPHQFKQLVHQKHKQYFYCFNQMSTIAQWGPSFTTEAVRATTPGDRAENIFDSFHYDFISFLSFARFHRVDFLPNKWDGNRNSLGRGATGDVKQSVVSLTTSFAFKRFINPNKETMFRELISEVSLLKQIPVRGHPNIVDLEGISFELDDDTGEATPVLVFKRAQFGSIRSFLETGGGRQLGFVKKLKLCSEIGSAIMALHASGESPK